MLVRRYWFFLKREDGPTAVEYAVMLALIVAVCVAAITTLGSVANTSFSRVGEKTSPGGIAPAVNPPPPGPLT